jgi:fumarate hydratase class II
MARIKAAAAAVNAELGVVDDDVAEAISAAAEEVASGRWNGEFPIDVFQTGSGTSSNMNMNEVLATLASDRLGRQIHPNDHVNASQSSNDVFPSSIHVAATDAVVNDLIPALQHLQASLRRKAEEFATVVKSGRTHLMDATPVTLGQEFGGYATPWRHLGCRQSERGTALLPGPETGAPLADVEPLLRHMLRIQLSPRHEMQLCSTELSNYLASMEATIFR